MTRWCMGRSHCCGSSTALAGRCGGVTKQHMLGVSYDTTSHLLMLLLTLTRHAGPGRL